MSVVPLPVEKEWCSELAPAHWASLWCFYSSPAVLSSTSLFAHPAEPAGAAPPHGMLQTSVPSEIEKKRGKGAGGSKRRRLVKDRLIMKNDKTDSNVCWWAHTSLLSLSSALSCCLLWSSSCVFSLRTASLSFSFSSRLRASSSLSRPSLEFSRLDSSSCCLSLLVSSCCSCSASILWDMRSCSWDYRHRQFNNREKESEQMGNVCIWMHDIN